MVVDVFREDVFVGGVAWGAVDEEPIPFGVGAGEFAEEIPASVDLAWAAGAFVEPVAGPVNRPQRDRVEPFGVEQCRLVVVAEDRPFRPLDHQIEAFAGVGAVADDIAQADDFFDPFAVDVLQDRLQRLEVAVNITDDGSFHGSTTRDKWA